MGDRRATAWREDTSRPARVGLPDGVTIDHGMRLVSLEVDPRVGSEVLLWIVGTRAELAPVVGHPDFTLWPRPFLLGTELGPVLEVLWILPDPADPTWPLWSFRTPVDPHGGDGLQVFEELAAQSHVHILATEPDGTVVTWIERDNPFAMELIEPYFARARELPQERLEDAIAQAELTIDREEMLIWDEERLARGTAFGAEEDLLAPSGEGRLALWVHRDLAAGRTDTIAAYGRSLRAQFGDDDVDRWFARIARRLPGDEPDLLFALWGMADRVV